MVGCLVSSTLVGDVGRRFCSMVVYQHGDCGREVLVGILLMVLILLVTGGCCHLGPSNTPRQWGYNQPVFGLNNLLVLAL
jgi:hypothetical protein